MTSLFEIFKITFTLRDNEPVEIVTGFESDARMGLNGPSMAGLMRKAVAHAERITAADLRALEAAHLN